MKGSELLQAAAKPFCEKIKSLFSSGSRILIVTHLDADGIISGSIMLISLSRIGCNCSVRVVTEMTTALLNELASEKRDFYVFTDLGGGWASSLRSIFGEKWIIVDHHRLPQEELLTDDGNLIFNAWKYGIDGGNEISGGGMAYELACALDTKNRDLSTLAIVSALGDRQDQGEKNAFLGVNAEILYTAESMGLVTADLDIKLVSRETKPIHEALAYTSTPYIHNLTWNSDKCYSLLADAGLRLKQDGRWRVLSELSQDEKGIVIDAIAKHVAVETHNPKQIVEDLIGYVYTIKDEDNLNRLKDAREFSTILNGCGRLGKSGVGIAICTGDRAKMLLESEEIIRKYRSNLRTYMNTLVAEKWRIIEEGYCVFVNGDGLIPEEMLGAVSSLLSGSASYSSRLVFVKAQTRDEMSYKFSSRRGLDLDSDINLGQILRESATSVEGTGGGHSAAAGCRIPFGALDQFLATLKRHVLENRIAIQS